MINADTAVEKTIFEIAPLIKAGELSPVALTQSMLERIKRIDQQLDSYLLVTETLALEQAETAEREINDGNYRGALHGIPIALKDLINTKSIATTCASRILRNFVPAYDAAVVERFNAAGAVILGKLNLTEFALYGYHPDYCPPKNPWHQDYWAGVSSSGSGAATAASLCFASLGTDTGGSIRFPSAACGLSGLKPSFGKISRYGIFPLADSLDHVGPMARSVEDCAIVLAALEGRDPRDGATRTDPTVDYLSELERGCEGLLIGVDRTYCSTDTDPLMTEATFKALDLMQQAGAEIVELNSPEIVDAAAHWMAVCSVDALVGHHGLFPEQADDYGPVFRAFLEHGRGIDAETYARANRQRQSTQALIEELLTGIDVMVCPAMPAPAGLQADSPPQAIMPTEDVAPLVRYSAPTNFSGHPSLTLPNGFTDQGLPTAMQFIGAMGDEASVLRAGAAYQALTDWHTRRPAL